MLRKIYAGKNTFSWENNTNTTKENIREEKEGRMLKGSKKKFEFLVAEKKINKERANS